MCIECAKHPSLKGFVKKHGSTGYECEICHRRDLIASAPAEQEALSSLVRALVRFQYDEWTYNGHWGGEHGPESILCDENPLGARAMYQSRTTVQRLPCCEVGTMKILENSIYPLDVSAISIR